MRRQTSAYSSARWAYQPLKAARRFLMTASSRAKRSRTIEKYLGTSGFHGLHIGCGMFRLRGWLNADLVENAKRDLFVDILEPLPFPDASLDAIYASEVIEHIAEQHAVEFFADAFRVLKPTGVIRLTTPDLLEICKLYLGENAQATINDFGAIWKGGVFTPDRWMNAQFRAHGHQHIWSFPALESALKQAGYATVTCCPPRVTRSRFVELADLERHYGKDAPEWAFARTIIVEGNKSGINGKAI